jgi:hypothetical protein
LISRTATSPRPSTTMEWEVAAMEVEKVDAPNCLVKITITQAVYDAIGRYATWRFHESGVFDYPLIEQRLAKV